MIHVSQMSWERVKHPSEILAEGQKVRVRVEKVDADTGKIGLSLKNPEEHPWTGIEQRFPVGTTVKGPVSRIAQFGAFVKLAPGVEGLIHISELAHHKVYKVENIVEEGQEVECKVLGVDGEAQRIGLSLSASEGPRHPKGSRTSNRCPARSAAAFGRDRPDANASAACDASAIRSARVLTISRGSGSEGAGWTTAGAVATGAAAGGATSRGDVPRPIRNPVPPTARAIARPPASASRLFRKVGSFIRHR